MSLLSRSSSTSALAEVEELKKSLIEKHSQPVQQTCALSPAASQHVVRVKDWVQEQEKSLGIKVEVVTHAGDLPDGALSSLCLSRFESQIKAVLLSDRIILVASAIETQKQAMDAYEQEVVGRYGVLLLLGRSLEKTLDQIFQSMGSDKLDYLNEDLGFDFDLALLESQRAAVAEHIARLASIMRMPEFEQRRVSWYRKTLRIFMPALQWTHDDVCALIQSARKKLQ